MATITVRRLDPVTWEPQWGLGVSNFISDVDAIAQIIKQRLQLLQGEWWENLLDGLPFWQSIAGFSGGGNNQQTISLIIQSRILSTPFVTGLADVQVSYVPFTRSYSFFAVVKTQFGQVTITNASNVSSLTGGSSSIPPSGQV